MSDVSPPKPIYLPTGAAIDNCSDGHHHRYAGVCSLDQKQEGEVVSPASLPSWKMPVFTSSDSFAIVGLHFPMRSKMLI